MKETTDFGSRSVRFFAMASAIATGLILANGGIASAAIDSSNQVVDHGDRMVEAIQQDTRIDFVPPLDGNPFTREWYHNGEAAFRISGPNAEDWTGHITVGYQVGFPATFSGKLRFEWLSPGVGIDLGGFNPGLHLNDLVPRGGIQLEVGPGPGIQTVECAGGEVSGSSGFIRMSGFHGTVTGVLGPTNIRPFVKVVSSSGDTVVTYGRLWTI
jgi:hypothetical protein